MYQELLQRSLVTVWHKLMPGGLHSALDWRISEQNYCSKIWVYWIVDWQITVETLRIL